IEGQPFRGFLYVGLMLTAEGPKVIEFNVRLGDPEAQVILPLVDEPLVPLLMAAASGRLIDGLADAERAGGVSVFHAGTALRDGQLVTAGGRVLTVVGRGSGFAE